MQAFTTTESGEQLPAENGPVEGTSLPNCTKYEVWTLEADGKYHHLAATVKDGVTFYYRDSVLQAAARETYNEQGKMVSSTHLEITEPA